MNTGNTLARMAPGTEPQCPICAEGGPRDVIAELAATWVSAPPVAPLPGYIRATRATHSRVSRRRSDAHSSDRPTICGGWERRSRLRVSDTVSDTVSETSRPDRRGRCTFERSADDVRRLGAEISAAGL
jgi:hypothetical protein